MRAPLSLFVVALVGLAAGDVRVTFAAGDPPSWAYPSVPQGFQRAKDEKTYRLPGSPRAYTYDQIEDSFEPADWYPTEHPTMPDPVGHGRRPNLRACGWCHLPNGQGHPQSSNLAGLPAAYIATQLNDFALGNRTPAVGGPNTIMGIIARAMTPQDIKAASEYFGRLKMKPWIRVVETRMSPATRIIEGNLRIPLESGDMERIGQRIVEVPETPARTRLYDSHTGFIAYVPGGSIRRGLKLVTTGGATTARGKTVEGKTTECTKCHGMTLRGMPAQPDGTPMTPPLAGRSPTYMFRQLHDIQKQTRRGANIALMWPVVAQLTEGDMIDIAAYLASRAP
jgi:cytochrome c553